MPNLFNPPTRDKEGRLRAVIETPAGLRLKIRFGPDVGTFELSRVLVLGVPGCRRTRTGLHAHFPYCVATGSRVPNRL